MGVDPVDYGEVAQDLRGLVVLEGHFQTDRRVDEVRLEVVDSLHRRRDLLTDKAVGRLRHQGGGGVEGVVPLQHRTLDVSQVGSSLLYDRIVSGDHDHRHAEVPGDGGADGRFGYLDSVEAHGGIVPAGEGVGSDAFGVGGTGVIPDQDRAVEGLVDSLHHAQRPRPGADQKDVLGKEIQQEILH